MDVKGKTTKQLLSLDEKDFLSLGRSDLAKVVSRLSSTANKRLKEFEERDQKSYATKRARKSGGNFSVKGKDLNALRHEYARVKTFLRDETSTVSGYNRFIGEAVEKLREIGVEISQEKYKRFTDLWDNLKEQDATVRGREMRYKVLKELSVMVENKNLKDETVMRRIKQRVDQLYQEKIKKTENSEFFTFENETDL